jgi:hypothetical protein
MRAQRVWRPVGPAKNNAEIERLLSELAALNRRVDEVERQHPERPKLDALKANAIMLARQIDELRCSHATERLGELLRK